MTKSTTLFLTALLCQVFWSARCLSQSTFGFANRAAGLDAPVFDANGNRLFGTNYVARLYGGPRIDSLQPARGTSLNSPPQDPVPFAFLIAGQAGYFVGPTALIANTECSDLAWLQVVAWDTRLGASYEEVAAMGMGGFGESSVFQARGGIAQPCSQNPAPPGLLFGLESFSLHPIPEPSTYLLLLLGLPGILLFHRRRSR